MNRTRKSLRRLRRPVAYRPLVERLEDRLPPGDAIFGAMLAGAFLPAERATGLAPVVSAARPGPARSLAASPRAQALPGHASLEALPPEGSEALASRAAEPQGVRAQAEPGHAETQTTANRRLPMLRHDDAPIANPGPMSSAPLALGVSGDFHSTVFVTPPLVNYQLDQAVAALAPPAESDDGAGIQSSGVHALFNLDHPNNGPFPSNVFTVPDRTQNTGRRVNMPFPDCAVYVSDCNDLNALNTLDGFNPQPRLSIPFSGPIDVTSVTSRSLFLVSLGSTLEHGWMPRGTRVGIDQVVWDGETNTLHVESDELLAQHTRFALIVTNGLRDADGDPVEASPEFRQFRETVPPAYRRELEDAIQVARRLSVSERQMVTASVFTTLSTTSYLEKIRDQIKAETPKPADFLLGTKGERTLFSAGEVSGITFNQQTRVDPPVFSPVQLNLGLLDVVSGAVGTFAYGKYVSPDYRGPDRLFPVIGTRSGTPVVQEVNDIYFNVMLPSGKMPAEGWPVAILGHGGGNNKNAFQFTLAAKLAERGVASVAINQLGHGFGPLSTLIVNRAKGEPVTFLAGGRGEDVNGDGIIGGQEGGGGDTARQFAADLMQLVRVLQVGADVDGDGARDLDHARIFYAGNSLGGINGIQFAAVEPDLRAAVLTVTAGGGATEGRLSPGNRDGSGNGLAARTPPLLNAPGITVLADVTMPMPYFHENLALRKGLPLTVTLADGKEEVIQSPQINTVEGALAIQEWMENGQWLLASRGLQPAYAVHLRRAPLPGVPAKPVLFQFGKGDYMQPNPGTTAILRAGDLADRTLYYRNDLAFAEDPTMPKNSHGFMVNPANANPLLAAVSRGAQAQIAAFFASDGKETIHPEPKRFFEVPIKGPLPEELNYIP